jgi:phosphoribosylaminoimidazolecarboxamide formyltransferase/IMP cyclohydrolase
MVRAAAKNHAHVGVVVDPADYEPVLEELARSGALADATRRELARKAFATTAAYDAAVVAWLDESAPSEDPLPATLHLVLERAQELRYGENPHQCGARYRRVGRRSWWDDAVQLGGKELSYLNLFDAEAAWRLVHRFEGPAAVIVKHANPCGVAIAADVTAAYLRAHACDPLSAFGGIVALNRPLDAQAARAITEIFTEVIIAPDASEEAIAIVGAKKNLRLLLAGGVPDPRAPGLTVKSVAGGLLVQSRDNAVVDEMQLATVTKRAPTAQELADLRFAFRVAKHVKSNTIVYAKGGATVGIGAGQMSRVDAARIAALKAQDVATANGAPEPATRGSVVASDAFFPFADGLLTAIEAGATAVIQPGGSVRDDEVIKAADAHGIAMVFTGTRHFRH